MLQRGRKSSATLMAPDLDGLDRLKPPASLSKSECAIFKQLVGAVDKKHFRESDLPLLCAYTRAIAIEQLAARQLSANPVDGKALALWEKATRALVALSMRLRLSPQSRMHPRTAASMPPARARPWESGAS
jgi:hypothetical protein